MCGIAGLFGDAITGGDVRLVGDMTALLEKRGPDGEGLDQGAAHVFGHRRLSIIDIEGGAQPMLSADGRYRLTFNGEIYNYLELRQRLAQQGVRFSTFSDTEVLLQTLIVYGPEGIEKLNGMFAFAFIDTHTGSWILGRDPFGVKPLYYALAKDRLLFASEIKSLLVHPNVQAAPSRQGLNHYLTFQFCLGEETLFKDIRRVEPGFWIEGEKSQIKKKVRYWDTTYAIDEGKSEDYFTDHLLTLLQDSVRLQVRSDVAVGAHLSGGMDSSVVSLLAADNLQSATTFFHGYFSEDPRYDESAYARQAADKAGVELMTVVPTAQGFADDIPELIYRMDEPAAGPGLYPQYCVSRLAARHVKVSLGGQGGDEVFGGYARYLIGYFEQALKGAIFETQEEGKHIVSLASIAPNLPLLREYSPLMQRFWGEGLFGDMDARYFRLIDRSPDVESMLTGDALAAFDRDEVFADFQTIFNHPDTLSYINKMTHFDLKTMLPALLHVEDRVSMAVSLESRVPLLDSRIVDLVTSMPPPMKFQNGQTKHILRKAVENILPPTIAHRKDKMGFPVPLKEWMAAGPVRDFVRETLLGQQSRERGLFRPEALEKLIDREGAFGRQLWGALCLELWSQRFL